MESVGEYEYSTKDLIGHGAFAVVFKGRHRTNHALTVAIKSITKKNLSKSQNLLGKEIKILKELTELHHENVVALLDCKETAHHVYLVMEYCNGGDLADYLHAKGTLSEDTIRFFLRQIAGAMRALYAKGIVHRDLKPQNILLCHAGKLSPTPIDITLKIADFGFARFLEDGVMAATLCGSPMYMAPEVIMSLQYDAKADLWSIGTIVFQCLTGKAPFQAQTPQALKQFYEKNCSISPRIPSGTSPELSNLLVQLLKRNAKDRMDFDEFFSHPFLQPVHRPNSPVRLHSYVSLSSDQESALSSVDFPSTPTTFALAPQTWFHKLEGMPQEGCAKDKSSSLSPEEQDFVIVSANLSEDMQCDTNHVNIKMHTEEVMRCSSTTNDSPLAPDVDQSCVWMPSSDSAHPSVSTATHGDMIAAAALPYTTSDPIPVPSQKKAYQKIQHSLQDFASSSPKISNELLQNSSPLSSITSSKSIPIPIRRGSVSSLSSELEKAADIAALSPPSVQFSIGASPTRRRRSYSSAGGISHTESPLRQRAGGVIHRRLFNHLPATGSPSTKEMVRSIHSGSMSSPCKESALTSLQGLDQKNINVISCPLKFTFASRTVPFPEIESKGFYSNSSPGSVMLPCQKTCWLGSGRDIHSSPNKMHLSSTNHVCGDSSAGSLLVLGSSPQDMNGTQFVAPDLPEETLLQKDHNETLAKLNFILALVECILDLARSRSTPLAILTDATLRKHRVDDVLLTNEGYRRAEQLVLYMRALQLLSSSLQLSKKEVQAGRLQPSASVKKVLCIMKKHYHHCVNMCRSLNNPSFLQSTGVDLASSSITADRLIYNYAIEMCQSAALEELFGNPEECFHHYQTAQILLHSLAQQVNDHQDKQLLNKYKDAVEKRLFVLHSQGYVYVYNSS